MPDNPGAEWQDLKSQSRNDTESKPTSPDNMVEIATQEPTQPVDDDRRPGRHLSDVSDGDLVDVICLLHPQSNLAHTAVKATMLMGPQHIHQNDDLEDITDFDLLQPQYQETREFALRLSSPAKSPTDGFIFGRNPTACDILLTDNVAEKLVSNKHFKIYVNNHGSLMLQDLSTNGTIVDDQLLRARRRDQMAKPPTLALKNGTIISVVCGPSRAEVKFMIRIPNRGALEQDYEKCLRAYLHARGTVANFASVRESVYGNHWNGGDLYSFTGNLGKGAFASVYRVQTKREGCFYAAKELDKRRFIKNGILDIKFDNELKIMQNLKHPNIVEYIDYQNYENWVYIIMELVAHGELSTELRSRSYLPEPEVQQITRQVLHALYYLHQRGVTHRDIKPDNILIASRDPLIVKLSDFGLSKCVSDQETFLKTFCGTLLYCAPEVYPDYTAYAQGAMPKRRRLGEAPSRPSPYDESVDMWSFGAVIFHLLCGKAPITGRGDDRGAQMLSNIMTKDVDFEPLRQHGISEEAIDFVGGLLNRDPLSRPKEPECLQHAWLCDVPDLVEYHDDGPGAELFRRALDSVDEAPEHDLDEDMLQELTQHSSSSPQRATKRPKMLGDATEVDVHYPSLPSNIGSSMDDSGLHAMPQRRLFGEITPSVLKSSGVFGAGDNYATEPGGFESHGSFEKQGMMQSEVTRDIQHGLETISVTDWRSQDFETGVEEASFPLPPGRVLASPSLLGAESDIQNLNMASIQAAESFSGSIERMPSDLKRTLGQQVSQPPPMVPVKTQAIGDDEDNGDERYQPYADENLPPRRADDVPTVAAGHFGIGVVDRKAETFQVRKTSYAQQESPELARTIDAATGRQVLRQNSLQNSPARNSKPSRSYGRLRSLPGSYVDVEIPLLARETAWGRSPACTYQYQDVDDTLIARIALKVHFHARGVEDVEKAGGDWTTVPGIETLISTSSSTYIQVNGVKLRKSSDDEYNFLYGKIYDGDVITVVDEIQAQGRYLKLGVEIRFGDSARRRPADEAGFQIQQMRTEKWKEHLRSGTSLAHGNGNGAVA